MTEQEHIALAARTLRVDESLWRQFKDRFAELKAESFEERVQELTRLWNSVSPQTAPPFLRRSCPVCQSTVQPIAARPIAEHAELVYGLCPSCGLGVLLSGGAADSIYSQASYYQLPDAGNAKNFGYENYLAEREYREAKGRRLIERIKERAARPLKNLLEVGSGFGFTRAAAEQLGMTTAGIDVNPHAAQTALEVYGQTTFTGTLAEAVNAKAIAATDWDVALYLFVLEHLPNPQEELALAAQMLSPGGVLALVVPNMLALEREIFGAAYRSFRRDHLWLFSVASLRLMLERAGLRLLAAESECNIRLLKGFLTEEELNRLDAECRSADLLVIAERKHT